MTIGIISAMDSEHRRLVERLQDKNTSGDGSFRYVEGTLGGNHVILTQCGFPFRLRSATRHVSTERNIPRKRRENLALVRTRYRRRTRRRDTPDVGLPLHPSPSGKHQCRPPHRC